MPTDPAGAEPIGVMVVDDHAFVPAACAPTSTPSRRSADRRAGDGEEALALLRRWDDRRPDS